jgi:hypothetical protein
MMKQRFTSFPPYYSALSIEIIVYRPTQHLIMNQNVAPDPIIPRNWNKTYMKQTINIVNITMFPSSIV